MPIRIFGNFNKSQVHRLFKSVWLFPVLLLLIVFVLTSLKISGSSIGIYHTILYGEKVQDPNLIYGSPQAIRSDEWLYITQMLVAQKKAGYPHINENVASGKDMSVIVDTPYKEWSVFFKPQNLPFFVLPLSYAFALKWWLLLYLLVVSCYFFTLRILPNYKSRYLPASLFSLAIGASPFVFWWYQTATIAPLFYGFFIMIIGMRIINKNPIPFIKSSRITDIIHAFILTYLLISFALVLYPPFQIPILIVVLAFFIGYLVQKYFEWNKDWKSLSTRLGWLFAALLMALVIIGIFVTTRQEALHRVTNTVYPGARIVGSGSLKPLHLFDSFLMPQLPRGLKGAYFFNNQSEVSNFILVMPFLLIPGLLLTIYERKKFKRFDYTFIAVQACALILLIRALIPVGDGFYELLLLHKVPNERLMIGIGFVGILHLIFMYSKINLISTISRKLLLIIISYCAVSVGILMLIGLYVMREYPRFIGSELLVALYAIFFILIIFTLLTRKYLLSICLLLFFSFISVVNIHPLYKGLGFIEDNEVSSKINKISQPSDTWVSVGNVTIENMGVLSNRHSIGGVQSYPDVEYWDKFLGKEYVNVYNRFAHIVFEDEKSFPEEVRLLQPDLFIAQIGCGDPLDREVEYVVSVHPIDISCFNQIDKIIYPQITFYLYKIELN